MRASHLPGPARENRAAAADSGPTSTLLLTNLADRASPRASFPGHGSREETGLPTGPSNFCSPISRVNAAVGGADLYREQDDPRGIPRALSTLAQDSLEIGNPRAQDGDARRGPGDLLPARRSPGDGWISRSEHTRELSRVAGSVSWFLKRLRSPPRLVSSAIEVPWVAASSDRATRTGTSMRDERQTFPIGTHGGA